MEAKVRCRSENQCRAATRQALIGGLSVRLIFKVGALKLDDRHSFLKVG